MNKYKYPCNVFQHNKKFNINKDTYTYVLEYKKQLIKNITNLLNDLQIRFVISNGNLIEYERGTPIYHDDDLDIRFCVDDIDKWSNYCSNIHNINNSKYNLQFDNRFNYIQKQRYKGIKAELIEFKNDKNINIYEKMKICIDLVANNIFVPFIWIKYNIDYNNLRKIKYLDVDTYAPSNEDTNKVLKIEYGNNYLIPNRRYKFDVSSLNI
jgi:hypothetical protein